ncbi:MAG: archaeal proteasome endopeptidase complex subunit beta [Candidatus Bathyarchaeia archaeon]
MLGYPADNIQKKVLSGTTTIGVVCKDGVVFATDTRATMGYFVAHKRAKKVYRIDDHVAMTIAGAVGDAQAIVDVLKANAQLYRFESGSPMPVSAAARLVANILFSARYTPFILQALIGGVDHSGIHIFALDPLGSLTEEKCVSTGSGSPIAYGVLESSFKEGMSVKETLPIVLKAIDSAMKRDAASGDDFDVATVTRDGYRELTKEEKIKLLKHKTLG